MYASEIQLISIPTSQDHLPVPLCVSGYINLLDMIFLVQGLSPAL